MKIEGKVVKEIDENDIINNALIFPNEAREIDADVTELCNSKHNEKIKYITFHYVENIILRYIGVPMRIGDFAPCAEYVILSNVKNIPDNSFYSHNHIQKVTAPEATEIGKRAFCNCLWLNDVEVPKCEVIGVEAFASSGLNSIALSDQIKEIRYGAFLGTSYIKAIDVHNAVCKTDAFRNSGIESLIVDKISNLKEAALLGCSQLKEIKTRGEIPGRLKNFPATIVGKTYMIISGSGKVTNVLTDKEDKTHEYIQRIEKDNYYISVLAKGGYYICNKQGDISCFADNIEDVKEFFLY